MGGLAKVGTDPKLEYGELPPVLAAFTSTKYCTLGDSPENVADVVLFTTVWLPGSPLVLGEGPVDNTAW